MKSQGFVFQIQNECVVASIQNNLHESLLSRLKEELLNFCSQNSIRGIVLDFSAIRIIDKDEFEDIRKIIIAAKLMGFKCVISGMRAGVVAYLVTVEANLSGVDSFRNLDQAMKSFDQQND